MIGNVSDFFKNIPVNSKFLYSALYSYTNDDIISLLEGIGVKTKQERGGRIFPVSDNANDVADGLCGVLKSKKVRIINDEVIHGIPSKKRILQSGDIVSIDLGAKIGGYNGDNAATFACGEISEEAKRLMDTTRESLYEAIKMAVPGGKLGDVASAVQTYCESRGYSVVREYTGHGIGKELHEDPSVPNYGTAGRGVRLLPGMTIAIEPMITLGKRQIFMERDGWTVRTRDRKNAAHFEHTIAVGKNGADILSSFEYVEEVLRKKGY